MNNNIKVSIITVCYNSAETIRRTIESVLGQTYQNIEYIIVDGNSKDDTMSIIEEYRDKIACVVSKPDKGLYHAMNRGIMLSTGDIIGIINSDDWYAEQAVDDVVECFMHENCELVYGKCTKVFQDGVYQECDCGDAKDLCYKMSIFHPAVFVKKEVYEQYGIFNQKYKIAADYELLCRFFDSGVKMSKLEKNIAFFTMNGISNVSYSEAVNESEEIALRNWDGKSIEVRKKIDGYISCRKKFARTKMLMNELGSSIRLDLAFPSRCQEKCVIFGAGTCGIQVAEFFNNRDCPVECFIDNDSSKWGQVVAGLVIRKPDVLLEEKRNVIIANLYHEEEISFQLQAMGYRQGCDFETIGNLLEKLK